MTTKKKVLENSFLYTFSSLLTKALGFLMLPLYTHLLTPDDYGVINLADSFIQVIIFLISFSMYSAAVRFYTDYKDNAEKLKRFYSSMINMIIITGVMFLLVSVLAQNYLQDIFFRNIGFYPIIFIASLTTIFLSLHTMHQKILQGMQQGRYLSLINVIVCIGTVLIKVFFIGVLELSAFGFLLSQLIVNILYVFFMIYDLKKKSLYVLLIDRSLLKEALLYSVPLIPHNLSSKIASFFSKVILNKSTVLASVGLYSIAMQFGGLIDTVQTSVNRAYQPWFYDMMNKNNEKAKKEVIEFSYLLLIAYSFVYMIIGLFSQEAILLMTPESYIESWKVIPIFVVGYSIKSLYYFFANVITYNKRAVKKLFLASLTGSFADVILALFLIPVLGMYGGATAFVLAKFLMVLVTIFISKSSNDVGFKITKMANVILPSLLFMAGGLYFSYTVYINEFNIFNLLYKILFSLSYIGYICLTNKKTIQGLLIEKQMYKTLWINIKK